MYVTQTYNSVNIFCYLFYLFKIKAKMLINSSGCSMFSWLCNLFSKIMYKKNLLIANKLTAIVYFSKYTFST